MLLHGLRIKLSATTPAAPAFTTELALNSKSATLLFTFMLNPKNSFLLGVGYKGVRVICFYFFLISGS
jgi:hypothetical protein